jgi:hypothetical protein
MTDYAELFKNEPSPYVWLPLVKLKRDYTCVEITGYPAAGHSRFVFWVSGDGVKTLLYFTSGLAEVVPNQQFTVTRVHGATSTKIAEGRVSYLMDEGSSWKDLGPITKEGRRPGDTDFESMRHAHLKNKSESMDEEEKKQLKKALKHDFWSKGGSF